MLDEISLFVVIMDKYERYRIVYHLPRIVVYLWQTEWQLDEQAWFVGLQLDRKGGRVSIVDGDGSY